MGLDVEITVWNPTAQKKDDGRVFEFSGRYFQVFNRIVCKSLKRDDVPNPLRCKLKRRTIKEMQKLIKHHYHMGCLETVNPYSIEYLEETLENLLKWIEVGYSVEYDASW